MAMSFDPKFSLGQVINLAVFIIGGTGAFYGVLQSIDAKFDTTNEKITREQKETSDQIDDLAKDLSTKLEASKNELTSQINTMRVELAVTTAKMQDLQKDVDGLDSP